jgi:hypothetical protein
MPRRSLRNRLGIQLVPRSGIVRRAEPPDGFTAFVSRSGRAAHGIDSIHPSMDRDRAVQEVLRAACSIDLSTRTSVGIPLPRRQALRRGRATGGQPRVRRTLPPLSHTAGGHATTHARAHVRTYVILTSSRSTPSSRGSATASTPGTRRSRRSPVPIATSSRARSLRSKQRPSIDVSNAPGSGISIWDGARFDGQAHAKQGRRRPERSTTGTQGQGGGE